MQPVGNILVVDISFTPKCKPVTITLFKGGSYASPGNGMIPASTTAELGSAEGSQMQIRCKFGQLGQGRGQFNAPHGFCLGSRDEEIVVADTHNHRIQVSLERILKKQWYLQILVTLAGV